MLSAPRERGQGLVEYALLICLIAIVAIATFLILGPAIGNVLTKLKATLLFLFPVFRVDKILNL